jgi:hypothetical protein
MFEPRFVKLALVHTGAVGGLLLFLIICGLHYCRASARGAHSCKVPHRVLRMRFQIFMSLSWSPPPRSLHPPPPQRCGTSPKMIPSRMTLNLSHGTWSPWTVHRWLVENDPILCRADITHCVHSRIDGCAPQLAPSNAIAAPGPAPYFRNATTRRKFLITLPSHKLVKHLVGSSRVLVGCLWERGVFSPQ